MADSTRFVSGAAAIAKALGVSHDTVLRMIKAGKLPAFRTGGRTSPYRIEVKSLDALRRPGKG